MALITEKELYQEGHAVGRLVSIWLNHPLEDLFRIYKEELSCAPFLYMRRYYLL
jgi:hypothetical protein